MQGFAGRGARGRAVGTIVQCGARRGRAANPVGDRSAEQAARDGAQISVAVTELHRAVLRGVVLIHHQHVMAALVGPDGGVGHQQGLIGGGPRDTRLTEQTGLQEAVGIGHHGPQANDAGRRVDSVVGEVQRAGSALRYFSTC